MGIDRARAIRAAVHAGVVLVWLVATAVLAVVAYNVAFLLASGGRLF